MGSWTFPLSWVIRGGVVGVRDAARPGAPRRVRRRPPCRVGEARGRWAPPVPRRLVRNRRELTAKHAVWDQTATLDPPWKASRSQRVLRAGARTDPTDWSGTAGKWP